MKKKPLYTLKEYYLELLKREGNPRANLVAPWTPEECKAIRRSFRRAFTRCHFERQPLFVALNVTGPALGNILARHVDARLNQHLRGFKIQPCPRQGYPDRSLLRVADNKCSPLEFKDTRSFEPKSTNRVSLTSSSRKLLRNFKPPIQHLLMMFCHRREGNKVWICDHRAVFLQPTTMVRIRLEASLGHDLISKSPDAAYWGNQA
jgi:hypothetical protein